MRIVGWDKLDSSERRLTEAIITGGPPLAEARSSHPTCNFIDRYIRDSFLMAGLFSIFHREANADSQLMDLGTRRVDVDFGRFVSVIAHVFGRRGCAGISMVNIVRESRLPSSVSGSLSFTLRKSGST